MRWIALTEAIIDCQDLECVADHYRRFVHLLRGETAGWGDQLRRAVDDVFRRRGLPEIPSTSEEAQASRYTEAWKTRTLLEVLFQDMEDAEGKAALDALEKFEKAAGINGVGVQALLIAIWEIARIDPSEIDPRRISEGTGNLSLFYGSTGGEKRRAARAEIYEATGKKYVDVEAERLLARIVVDAYVVESGRGGLLSALRKNLKYPSLTAAGHMFKQWRPRVMGSRKALNLTKPSGIRD